MGIACDNLSIASQESLDMDDGEPEKCVMGILHGETPSTVKKNIKTLHNIESDEQINKNTSMLIACDNLTIASQEYLDTADEKPENFTMGTLKSEMPSSLKKNISTKGFKSKSSNNKENVNKFNPSDIASFQINQTENSKSSDSSDNLENSLNRDFNDLSSEVKKGKNDKMVEKLTSDSWKGQ